MEERLELDIESGLASIDRVEEALTGAAQSFKVALGEALDLLTSVAVGDVDASSVTSGIDAAVQAADLAPEIEADATGVTSSIDDAVAAADLDAVVEADATGVTAAIDDAVQSADAEVKPDVVTEDITGQIEQAVSEADSTIEVGADTSAAESEIAELGATADETSESTQNLSGALDGLGGVSQLAAGDVGGIAATLGAVNENASLVTGVVLSAAGAMGVLFDQALDSETAQDRFNRALGDTAAEVSNIEVAGLAADLEQLAENTGSSDEAMKLAAARIADLGRSAGASDESISSTAENILLLATRAAVLNPTLGDAGDIADRLTGALARGGRTTAAYGIALTAAEIEARALRDTGKETAAELTVYERAAAGAAIVTAKLGTSLKDDIVAGSQGTQIQLRALREEFGNTLEAFGEPLLDEVLAGIRTGQPLLLGLAETFGQLGEVAIPLLVEGLEAFAPIMGTTTDVLVLLLQILQPIIGLIDAIPDPLLQAAAAMALFSKVSDRLAIGLFNLVGGASGGLKSLPALLGAINPVTAAVTVGVGLLAVAWQKHAKEQAESNARVREGAKAFEDEATAIGDAIESIAEKRIPENQLDDIRRMGLNYKEVGDLARDAASGGLDTFLDTAVQTGEISASVGAALKANGGDVRDLRINFESLGVSQRDMNDSNIQLIETFQSLSGETQESAKAALEHLSATGSLTSAQQELVDAVLDSNSGNLDYVGILADVKGTSEGAAEGTDELTGALEEEIVTAEEAEAALQSLLDAIMGFVNSQIAAENANLKFRDSLVDVNEKTAALAAAVRDAGRGTAEATEAQRALDDAVRSARDAAVSAAEANVRLAIDTGKVQDGSAGAAQQFAIYRQSLVDAANQASGPTKQALLDLITQIDATKAAGDIRLQIEADTAAAERALASLERRLANMDRGLIGVTVSGKAMAGGSFTAGDAGMFIETGERGRELAFVQPNTTMTVIPNNRTEDILANGFGGGGSTFNIYPVTDDPEEVAFGIDARLGSRRR